MKMVVRIEGILIIPAINITTMIILSIPLMLLFLFHLVMIEILNNNGVILIHNMNKYDTSIKINDKTGIGRIKRLE